MAWEIAAAVIGLVPLVHWICIDRRYTAMMRKFDEVAIKIEKHMMRHGIDNNSHEWVPYCDQLQIIASLNEIGKDCRYMGRRGLLICAMSFAGAVMIGMIVTDPVIKWLVFLVCAGPIYNIVTHFRDIFVLFNRRASSAIGVLTVLPRR